jgi:hypothetical protein
MIAKPVGWTTGGLPRHPEAVESDIANLGPDQVLVRIDGHQENHVGCDNGCDTAHGSQEVCPGVHGRVMEAGADALWYVDRSVIIPAGGRCETCDTRQRGRAMARSDPASIQNDGDGATAEFVVVRACELCVVSVIVDWQKPIPIST